MEKTQRPDGKSHSRAETTRSIHGFGLVRIGIFATHAPIATAIIILLTAIVAVFGASRLKTDDALSDLFRSKTPIYEHYQKLVASFPASESAIFLVIEGDGLLDAENLEELRSLHLELNLSETVTGVTSIFSIRETPDEKGYPAPIFPSELPEGDAYRSLLDRVKSHPLVSGRLLSDRTDGVPLALFIVSLDPELLQTNGLKTTIKEIEDISREIIEPLALQVGLTGVPVMKMELVEATKRDRIIFNALGFCVGFFICLVFFRKIRLVMISNIPPIFSVIWSLALLGFWNMSLNPLNTTILPLVMVITITNSMHLTFSIKRQIEQGANRFQAARHAILTVGPACALTSLTTTIALLSLILTDSGLIRNFGMTAGASTILAFISVITITPTLAVLLLREDHFVQSNGQTQNRGLIWLDQFCKWLAEQVSKHAFAIATIGLALVAFFTVSYLQLTPYYRLSDIVPDGGQSAKTLHRLDMKLSGVHPLYVMIEWPEDQDVYIEDNLSAIAETDRILGSIKPISNVWSADDIRRWLDAEETASPEKLKDYIEKLPKHLPQRFLNIEKRTALVTGYIPDLKANEIIEHLEEVKLALEPLKKRYPHLTFTVTGLPILSASRSIDIIGQLNISLLGAVIIVILLIGAAFRSISVAILCTAPNLFALVATGAAIHWLGNGLEYSSVVALTVAFGLAVDDTIHFLNRLQLEQNNCPNFLQAVGNTIIRIGPVLILTSIVLVLGMSVTGLSGLPPIRLFGELCIVTLIFALIGDLIILPALLASSKNLGLLPKNGI